MPIIRSGWDWELPPDHPQYLAACPVKEKRDERAPLLLYRKCNAWELQFLDLISISLRPFQYWPAGGGAGTERRANK